MNSPIFLIGDVSKVSLGRLVHTSNHEGATIVCGVGKLSNFVPAYALKMHFLALSVFGKRFPNYLSLQYETGFFRRKFSEN